MKAACVAQTALGGTVDLTVVPTAGKPKRLRSIYGYFEIWGSLGVCSYTFSVCTEIHKHSSLPCHV